MKDDKIRLCVALPAPLYERLQSDSSEYGVSKCGIISMLLVNYYKGNVSLNLPETTAVKK